MTDYPDPQIGSDGGILHAGVFGVDYLCMVVDHVGVDEALDTPGKELSVMERKYSSAYTGQHGGYFGPTKTLVPLPSHAPTGKRVKGWEGSNKPVDIDGNPVDILNVKNHPPLKETTGIFVGPVFRYYEFIAPINQRVTKQNWNDIHRSRPKTVSRPEW
eukprot:CAMPEP_0117064972 /NCGR_PEP_ID=MMETSP0472-20121206/45401_1 /TAXON_ID=693140 ORGANISM="Tiarina fusus, Strain LIS" /NCGR_SAMPLE_ID=MMETSP0472 /ASSEMBLY_ACC=CAM_ASM_000603 /LENGTH=158 /DNA_ID=CAMNT_0004785373 /DNA_START=313 /DNA_END=786 /DNA_ORIENTATION=+